MLSFRVAGLFATNNNRNEGNDMDQYNPFAALSVILGSLLLTAVGAPAQAAGLPVIISTDRKSTL